MSLLPTESDGAATDVGLRPEAVRFDTLMREYRQLLRSAIARFCPPNLGLNVDDIEQEAVIRIWQLVRSEREVESPASYLYRIAATTTIDAVRRVKRRREDQLRVEGEEKEVAPTRLPPDAEKSPETLFRRREIREAVQTGLQGLQENRRRAVGLHLQGMTTEEIARMAGWTEPKARNLVYRGLADLREALKGMGVHVETH
jgi:RNA polymerase sigma factor (sigma-70 family)